LRQGLARVLSGAAIVALIAGAAACNSGSKGGGSASKDCGLKIAFFGALTGDAANLGINIKNGAKLAVEQYNDKHKDCTVELKEFDSQGDEKQAPGLARQLVQDKKIIGVIGPAFSGESVAADPIFNEAGVTTITPSATRPSLSTNGWKVFHRGVANDDSQGPAAANYIKKVINAQKVFVMDDQSAYGSGLADVVKKQLGSLVVDSDKVTRNVTKDFSGSITKIQASGATVVFYGGYYQEAGLLVKQMRAKGVTATLVAGDGVADNAFAETAGKEAAEGSVVTCPCAPPTAAKGSFVTDYKAKWNQDAGTYSDVAYDIANIFLQGIEKGNTTNEKMLTYVNGVQYQGIANTFKFTDKGELDPSLFIVWAFKFKDGKQVPDQAAPTS
jgi:branched-chain amino acid transport system substrate-binding protein